MRGKSKVEEVVKKNQTQTTNKRKTNGKVSVKAKV